MMAHVHIQAKGELRDMVGTSMRLLRLLHPRGGLPLMPLAGHGAAGRHRASACLGHPAVPALSFVIPVAGRPLAITFLRAAQDSARASIAGVASSCASERISAI
jgi:hypothetical protein